MYIILALLFINELWMLEYEFYSALMTEHMCTLIIEKKSIEKKNNKNGKTSNRSFEGKRKKYVWKIKIKYKWRMMGIVMKKKKKVKINK